MNNKKFMIYADGGSKVCMGHIMRTITLAVELKRKNVDVLFVTSSDDAVDYINHNGFDVIKINKIDYNEIAGLAKNNSVNGIMVDRFGFNKEQHQLLVDEVGLLVHIDDFLYDGPANLVINSTIDIKPEGRNGVWLCGGEYALIRNKFVYHDRIYADNPQKILLTTGYGDPVNIHLIIIKLIKKVLKQIQIDVVVGGGYKTKEKLYKMAEADQKIILHENVTDLSDLMKIDDVAVSAAGTSLYELAAAGMPSIAFSLYDNQIDNIERVAKKGCILSLGWYENIDYNLFEKYLIDLYKDGNLRRKLGTNGFKWIDGKGTERIADKIIELM